MAVDRLADEVVGHPSHDTAPMHREHWSAVIITVAILGLLAALDPIRPVVFVLVLRTEGALVNAVALLIGWAVSLTVLFLIGFAISDAGDAASPRSRHPTRASVLELVLGVILLLVAARQWRKRNDEDVHLATPQAILRRLDGLTPRRAGIVGMLLQPRSLTIAAALVIARDHSSFASSVIGFGVFALLSTAGLLGILAYKVRNPDEARIRLTSLVTRLEQSGPLLFTGLMAFGGVYLLIDAIRSLVGS